MAQDDEVSPWPRVPGVGDGPTRALAALAARYEQEEGLGCLITTGDQGQSLEREGQAAARARRELAMSAVLPLLPPSAALPCPGRRDVHLDYAPFLQAMQRSDEAHALAEAAGEERAGGRLRRSRRGKNRGRRSYWDEVCPEGARELHGHLQQLVVASGLVVQGFGEGEMDA